MQVLSYGDYRRNIIGILMQIPLQLGPPARFRVQGLRFLV